VAATNTRLAAYKRAFKKASLRWHPDKFEGRFGALLCDERYDAAGVHGDGGGFREAGATVGERETMQEDETQADAIRRRVRCISQQINDAWSAVSS
jgi:hypothetical protein